MRGEIKRLHQEIATTMIYVTHDQIEAMTLADRIVLMRDGVIEQQGAPLDLFERPATTLRRRLPRLAQDGLPARPAVARRRRRGLRAGRRRARAAAARRPGRAPARSTACPRSSASGRSTSTRRPAPRRRPARSASTRTIELLQPTGSRTYATFRIGGTPVVAELEAHDVSRPGETIAVDINLNRASLFDAATQRAIPTGPRSR